MAKSTSSKAKAANNLAKAPVISFSKSPSPHQSLCGPKLSGYPQNLT